MDKFHHPQVVENNAGWRRLDMLGATEILSQADERRNAFKSLSLEDYSKFTDYIHALHTQTDRLGGVYQDGKLPMMEAPPAEDKAELMELTFSAVKEILENSDFDDKTALRRAGLTMAGAINYIHPFNDGNGRTGRVWHYLMEFGTERGKEPFESEMYAIVAKTKIEEDDQRNALYNTPPGSLERALDDFVQAKMPKPESPTASLRVVAFLDMMTGKIDVPINENVKVNHGSIFKGNKRQEHFASGEINGVELYDKESAAASMISLVGPRTTLVNRQGVNHETISLNMDLV